MKMPFWIDQVRREHIYWMSVIKLKTLPASSFIAQKNTSGFKSGSAVVFLCSHNWMSPLWLLAGLESVSSAHHMELMDTLSMLCGATIHIRIFKNYMQVFANTGEEILKRLPFKVAVEKGTGFSVSLLSNVGLIGCICLYLWQLSFEKISIFAFKVLSLIKECSSRSSGYTGNS